MTALAAYKALQGVSVVYDGYCPFCSAYTRMLRLKDAAAPVRLIDARQTQDLVAALGAAGMPINDGMAVFYAGRVYYGGDAVHVLAMLSSGNGLANRWTAKLLRSKARARMFYPILRAGRNLSLRVMGRSAL